ncbi:FAD-binding protein [Amycolatopsis granulosa]|uniref:FAD-binding protein n=1 Tax=Amycolatopsis granulosa TaxID=185684 RepID=UPI0014207D17|nr:FAD-binding protein [Amycolatopsis granulosa]NIH88625.1 FAD/FMN-containing dehydrogenase [Amycolatopsis granulosa]
MGQDAMTQVVAGWDPARRCWTTQLSGTVVTVPPLAGELLVDDAARDAASRDLGRLVTHRPGAVLRPATAEDVATMVRLCHDHHIPVAPQGTHHQTQGQSLVRDGLVVDMTSLGAIRPPVDGVVDVDAGVLWSDLVRTLAGPKLAFAGGLTGYVPLSVGGTLSAGGISPNYRLGAQVDFVRRLQIVTGRGEIRWASETENPDLFAAALGGLGQVGIITRAELALMSMPTQVRTWVLPLADAAAAFRIMRTLIRGGLLDEVYCMIMPPGMELPGGGRNPAPTFLIHLARYEYDDGRYASADPVDGLDWTGPAQQEQLGYLDHALKYSGIIDQWRQAGWDERRKPWFDVFLADSQIGDYVTSTLSRMTPDDWSAPHGEGFVLLFPHRAGAFRRPRLRLPEQQPDELIWLFDVLTCSEHDPEPGYAEAMLARNRDWIAAALARGGVVYPIGSHGFTAADWRRHYGPHWDAVVATKQQFDPARILTPGQGIAAALP